MRFEIARPTFEEAEKIWKWRLDPEVMKNSLTFYKPIPLEEFFPKYVSTYFTIPELPPLYPLYQGERAGILRFNVAPGYKSVEISIVVAKEFRGQGVGSAILHQISHWVKEQRFCSIVAKIRPYNKASIKAFENAGYKLYCEEADLLTYKLQLAKELSPKVFVIAEVGSNWTSADPFKLIDLAADAGADAVKFQVFRASSTYAPNAGSADYLDQDIESLFKELEMPYDKIEILSKACEQAGLEFMATPFSLADFNAIDPYVKRHKIASYENNHIPLLKAIVSSQKPILMSSGATTESELAESFNYLKMMGAEDITLLQCLAKYPADPKEMNLRVIPQLSNRFRCPVGLSDHTKDPYAAPLAAVALGATVIEKHYTLDRSLKGPDHSFAINPSELKSLVNQIRLVEKMLGSSYKQIEPSEMELRHFARRGVQAIKEIATGEVFREGENIEILRPGKNSRGDEPKNLEFIQGKQAKKSYAAGEGVFND